MDNETYLHLFLCLVFLTLLVKFFGVAPATFDTALFACISTPAMYALAYYHAQMSKLPKFVRKKNEVVEQLQIYWYEFVALLMSFMMGYMVYVALSPVVDVLTYVTAYATVQIARLLVSVTISKLQEMGVDVQHPLIVSLVSLAVATTMFAGLALVFQLL